MNKIPHLNIVVLFCVIAIGVYAGFSVYVLGYMKDSALIGDTVGTWKSFAFAAFAFWIGSSSAGKAKDPETPTGKPRDPVHVVDETNV
jgi:hypothetical protein